MNVATPQGVGVHLSVRRGVEVAPRTNPSFVDARHRLSQRDHLRDCDEARGSEVRRASHRIDFGAVLSQAACHEYSLISPCTRVRRDHFSAGGGRDQSRSTRRSQFQAAMRSVAVVVLDVLSQNCLQMPPVHDQQPVQALAADTGDPAFALSIRIRRPHRGADDLQALGSKDGIDGGRKVAVAIVDQEAGSDPGLPELPGQVPRLLGGPGSAGALAAGREQDAPAGQLRPG